MPMAKSKLAKLSKVSLANSVVPFALHPQTKPLQPSTLASADICRYATGKLAATVSRRSSCSGCSRCQPRLQTRGTLAAAGPAPHSRPGPP